jgi:hypothetical protein
VELRAGSNPVDQFPALLIRDPEFLNRIDLTPFGQRLSPE